MAFIFAMQTIGSDMCHVEIAISATDLITDPIIGASLLICNIPCTPSTNFYASTLHGYGGTNNGKYLRQPKVS